MLHYMSSNRPYKYRFEDAYMPNNGNGVLGIVKDPFYGHEPYMAACKEIGVGYIAVDVFASDWIEQINKSKCDVFLVWPGESIQEVKRLYDDRLRFIVEHMRKKVFPDLTATWIYGSKERQSLWMDLHDVPHPLTNIFYKKDEALGYVSNLSTYPIVAKTDIGAVSSGVRVLRSSAMAAKYIDDAFSVGIQGYFSDPQARQWRHVLFQEYLPGAREWRMVRVGDSFFGYVKERNEKGFASGSHKWSWQDPGVKLLDFMSDITDRAGFRSVAIDVFQMPDGKLLVNEIQTVFGCSTPAEQMKINGVEGRYRRLNGEWKFEQGSFCTNMCCNLRVEEALKLL